MASIELIVDIYIFYVGPEADGYPKVGIISLHSNLVGLRRQKLVVLRLY